MSENDNQILFNFTYLALRLLGRGLYSNPWSAITELVANGIDAGAEKIRVLFDLTDKAHASIEIMDDGSGMDFNDLSTKYALIGKNKRNDSSLTEEQKNSFMGRKGIGKLAALYLSKKYYIFTKTLESSETIWCLNSENVDDSDIPRLDKVSRNEVRIKTSKYWDEQEKGTLILLTNVNMVGIGEQRMNAFSTRLANYYLLDELNSAIELCVLEGPADPIVFHPVEKSIAFKNMYAFFNNVDSSINEKISERVYVPSKLQQLNNITYPVRVLNPTDFECSGYESFADSKGITKNLRYELVGWIGIHSSINKSEASRNDDAFIKNNMYKPSQLRLYVRKKLAIENLLDYLGVTQAFANYIEGEISFDVLDSNELEDIATSNRQGFAEDDERFLLLIKLVKRIITALIRERVAVGTQVGKEEERIREEEKRKKEEEIERAKKAAEYEKGEKEKERKAKDAAQKRANEAENLNIALSENLEQVKSENLFLSSDIKYDVKQLIALQHHVTHSTGHIHSFATKAIDDINNSKYGSAKDKVNKIIFEATKIETLSNFVSKARFNTETKKISNDVVLFINEYLSNVYSVDKAKLKINIEETSITCKKSFTPIELIVLLDNLLDNSDKAHARNVFIRWSETTSRVNFSYSDDGDGISDSVLPKIFDYRFSTTSGGGLGMYHVKDICKKMNIELMVNNSLQEGVEFVFSFSKEGLKNAD